MRKFSDSIPAERDFEIGGEVFHWRIVYWEDLAEIFDSSRNGEMERLSEREAMEKLIGDIARFLEPDERERWNALAHRRENPIPYSHFQDLYAYLLGAVSGRPPAEQPSSLSGPRRTTPSSRAGSS